ncbi:MAG TPA: PASTA domain-containing protein, partial [Actinomycetota bacterium]
MALVLTVVVVAGAAYVWANPLPRGPADPPAEECYDPDLPPIDFNTLPPCGEQADVPDVVGLSLADANAALHADELRVGELTAVRNKSPMGTVLAQAAEAGSRVPPSADVSLIVSAGPDPKPARGGSVVVGSHCDIVDPDQLGDQACFGG